MAGDNSAQKLIALSIVQKGRQPYLKGHHRKSIFGRIFSVANASKTNAFAETDCVCEPSDCILPYAGLGGQPSPRAGRGRGRVEQERAAAQAGVAAHSFAQS